jgi:hypothetical protein
MSRDQPPRVATWLLRNFGCSSQTESVIGDLVEQYQRGRSRIWYWRQVGIALVVGAQTKVLRKDRVLMRQVLTWTLVLAGVFSLGVWTGKRLWINVETLSTAEMQSPRSTTSKPDIFSTVDFLQMELDKARLNSTRDRSEESQQQIEQLQLKLQAAQAAALRGKNR